jgi:hypothetical protein
MADILFKNIIIFNFEKLMATKEGETPHKNFPYSSVADPGCLSLFIPDPG